MGLPRDSNIDVKFNGREATYSQPGSFSLRFDGYAAHDIPGTLQPLIMLPLGAAFTSGSPEPSHAQRALDIPRNKESLQAGCAWRRLSRLQSLLSSWPAIAAMVRRSGFHSWPRPVQGTGSASH